MKTTGNRVRITSQARSVAYRYVPMECPALVLFTHNLEGTDSTENVKSLNTTNNPPSQEGSALALQLRNLRSLLRELRVLELVDDHYLVRHGNPAPGSLLQDALTAAEVCLLKYGYRV